MTSIFQRKSNTGMLVLLLSEGRERCKTKSKSKAKELPGVWVVGSSSVAVQQPTGYFSSHSFAEMLMHRRHEKASI